MTLEYRNLPLYDYSFLGALCVEMNEDTRTLWAETKIDPGLLCRCQQRCTYRAQISRLSDR